jgi:FG-GAP-like repeat
MACNPHCIPKWTEHNVVGDFNGAGSVYAKDVDGDGYMDVLGAASYADSIILWRNTSGDGLNLTEQTVEGDYNGAYSVYAEDVDGDGYMDVLGAAFNDDDITWWKNNTGDGTNWTEQTIEGSFDGAYSVHAADVDGDGYMDVLGAANNGDSITWWKNNTGDGTDWTENVVDADFDGAQSVYAVDIDGDGYMDVLGAAKDADDISWWRNTTGDGTTWAETFVDEAFDGAASVYPADIDGDGYMDILGAGHDGNIISWWRNTTGNGTSWIETPVRVGYVSPHSVYSADMDGDGDMDVLGAARSSKDITWWENTEGDGTAWTEHTVDGEFAGAQSVYATDMDGDGDPDVLGAARTDGDITWWENDCIP